VLESEVDIGAFRAAAAPLLAEYRRDPQLDSLYTSIQSLA
jgi:hypothetical protein